MLFRRERRTQQYFWKIFSLLPAPLSQPLCRIDAETFRSSLLALRRFRCRFRLLGGDNAQPASRNGRHKIRRDDSPGQELREKTGGYPDAVSLSPL